MNTRKYKEKEERDAYYEDVRSTFNYIGKAEREKKALLKRVKARRKRKSK